MDKKRHGRWLKVGIICAAIILCISVCIIILRTIIPSKIVVNTGNKITISKLINLSRATNYKESDAEAYLLDTNTLDTASGLEVEQGDVYELRIIGRIFIVSKEINILIENPVLTKENSTDYSEGGAINLGSNTKIVAQGTEYVANWKVSNKSVCKIEDSDETSVTVTGLKVGTCDIEATINGDIFTYTVTVEDPSVVVTKNAEAYQNMTVKAINTESEVSWDVPAEEDLKLIRNGNECQIYSESSGEFNIEYTVNGETKMAPVTFSEHTHDYSSEWYTVQAATCTEEGLAEQYCSICGDEIDSEPIAATGHSLTETETIQEATVLADGISAKRCTTCGEFVDEETVSYASVVQDEMNNRGMMGRFDIPDFGYSVGLFWADAYDLSQSQNIVNNVDSAAYFTMNNMIGDHSSQGFSVIKSCVPYQTIAYITDSTGIHAYQCVDVNNGINGTYYIQDAYGNSLWDNTHSIVTYTCNSADGYYITVVYWDQIW